jgi:hypothetical protein
MTPDISRNKALRPPASPVPSSRSSQEQIARSMAPTIFCPSTRIDQCLRAQPRGGTKR